MLGYSIVVFGACGELSMREFSTDAGVYLRTIYDFYSVVQYHLMLTLPEFGMKAVWLYLWTQ